MAENDKRPHLLISGTATTEEFTSPRVRGSEAPMPTRNRHQHGQHLLEQLVRTRQAATQILTQQHANGVDVGNGIYLEFESEPGFELPVETLSDARKKVELIAVKERDQKTFATVFVPEGKLDHFERKVIDYLERETKSGKPSNEKLVAQIQNIRLAAVEALWTDHPAFLPSDDQVTWWEVWLRISDDPMAVSGFFREHGRRIGLEIPEQQITFPERVVINVRGSKPQISHSIQLLNLIAELRKPKDTAEFFVGLAPYEQREWMQDLRARLQPPAMNAPAVCVLDTGVNQGHPLIEPVLDPGHLDTIDPAWGVDDRFGHGTQVAGLAIYGDLVDILAGNEPVFVNHRLESVKLLPRPGANAGELYGELTRQAVARAEIFRPDSARVICMPVSSIDDRDRGRPSTWSAAIDGLCAGVDDDTRRLMIVAAGNIINREHWTGYPARNSTEGIHDPGQAWNALTIGACTDKDWLDSHEYPGWETIAPKGALAPSSCTSQTWESRGQLRAQWPLKPDIVLEGGNAALNADGEADAVASLDLLTTHHNPLVRPFDRFGDTSAATALAAGIAADIQVAYPEYWPETIRALMVHSANWTDAMLRDYANRQTKTEMKSLIRHCGFGVPSLSQALWSAGNALTLVAQDELQPFDEFETISADGAKSRKIKTRDMHLHAIPWPREVLAELGETEVELKVTLSYFIEPNPAARGWTRRYRYESHGLRFDVKRPAETLDQFRHRVNLHVREEEEGRPSATEDSGWLVGRARHLGSLHSDRWIGTAAELAERGYIAVYPALGWWKERKHLERWRKRARYSLVISISAPEVDVDIYSTVSDMIGVRVPVLAR